MPTPFGGFGSEWARERLIWEPLAAPGCQFLPLWLCGLGHYRMRGEVVVEPLEDLQKWLAEQPTFADLIP
ncbi:MAG: hypothetical protein C4295_12295 [Candidatus Fervidibacterota bacterium]